MQCRSNLALSAGEKEERATTASHFFFLSNWHNVTDNVTLLVFIRPSKVQRAKSICCLRRSLPSLCLTASLVTALVVNLRPNRQHGGSVYNIPAEGNHGRFCNALTLETLETCYNEVLLAQSPLQLVYAGH